MRITNLMIQRNLMSGLRGRMAAIATATNQASTGRRINTVSDAPVDASQVMRLQSQVNDLQQYIRNGTSATTKLSVEDAAISSLSGVLTTAKSVAMSTTAPSLTDPSRTSAIRQVTTLKEQLVALGNSQVGDQYIFGGDYSTTPPFQSNGTFVGNGASPTVDIAPGVSTPVTHSGQPLFTDAITAVNNLLNQLQTGTPDQINACVTDLNNAMQGALQTQSEVGERMQSVKDTGAQLATQSSALLDQRDALANVDPAQAIVTLQSQQSALEQAYAVVNRVMQTTLTDYLK